MREGGGGREREREGDSQTDRQTDRCTQVKVDVPVRPRNMPVTGPFFDPSI